MSAIDNVRTNIRTMPAYVPGEQPAGGGYIRLNTNENPYPPSPRVMAALQTVIAGGRLQRYPDPTGKAFRQAAGKLHGVDPDCILIGNGSDDVLTVLTRTLVPEGGLIAWPTPGYVLYRTLATIQGAQFQEVPFTQDWTLPKPWPVRGANLTIIANPNAPSGTCIPAADLALLDGPLVIDEAYVDFAERHCLELLSRPDVIVTRTLSKSYALAGMRFGYAIADPALTREFNKVKDTYNCDALSLEAARAALEDQDYLRETRAKILATRARLATALRQMGFELPESQANFVWCKQPGKSMKPIYEALRQRRILVRYFVYEGHGDGLRITVGTDEEVRQLLAALKDLS